MSGTSETGPRERFSGPGRLAAVAVLAVLPYVLLPAKPLLHDAALAIAGNPVVRTGSFVDAFRTDFWGTAVDSPASSGSYRPLVTLTWIAQARLVGTSAAACHVVDVAVHAGVAVLFVVALGTLGIARRWHVPAAMLFAWHPLASEAVASAVGRADLLAAAGLLAALSLHRAARNAPRRWAFEAGALVALAAAMLCKEYAVAFPFVLIVVDLAIDGVATARADGTARFWGAALAVLAGYLAMRWAVLGSVGGVPMLAEADQPLLGRPWTTRLATASWIAVRAGALVLAPVGLDHYYAAGSLPVVDGLLDPRAVAGAALVAAAVALAAHRAIRRGDPVPAAAVALFLLPLAPSLNTVSIAGVLFAERWMVLPLAGAALGAARALEWAGRGRRARAALAGTVAVAAALGAGTVARVQDWSSAERLARSSLDAYPDTAKIWNELGLALGAQGRHEDAARAFERAVELRDDDPRTWKNLATAWTNLGRHDDAARAWRRVVEHAPEEAAALLAGLGIAELRAGRPDDALAALRRANERAPEDAAVRGWLAQALVGAARARLGAGEAAAARSLAGEAVDLGTLPPEGTFEAGLVAFRAGDRATAAAWFDDALGRDPDVLRRRHESAIELERAGRPDEAADLLRGILAARPDHVATLFNLGRILVLAGRPGEAIEPLRRGLAAQDDPRARTLLERALADSNGADSRRGR